MAKQLRYNGAQVAIGNWNVQKKRESWDQVNLRDCGNPRLDQIKRVTKK